MTRLHVDQPLQTGSELQLDGQAFSHAVRVLRLKAGDRLRLFSGDGSEHEGRILAVARHTARVEIGERFEPAVESPLPVALWQAVSKGERMDWALQKATECGVSAIQPVLSRRGNVQLDAARWQKKQAHWQGVVVAACEQSGRVRVPAVDAPRPLPELLQDAATHTGAALPPDPGRAVEPSRRADAAAPPALRLLLDPEGQELPAGEPPAEITLLVGPEGGFDPAEIAAAEAAGFRRWRIGPRVLRTETAPVAALTLLQARWGDLADRPPAPGQDG